jgi:uncharacterized membrane protein YdjX (TVP38/TMEM64 family)
MGRIIKLDLDNLRQFLLQYPIVLSGVIFIFFYVTLTFFILFGPKDILRIASAIIFGPYVSTVLVWIGECLNAVVLFNLSRRLGRDFIVERFKIYKDQFNNVNDDTSFIGTFALRINPLIPFRVMDLGAGLSKISISKYLTVVVFASIPRVFWQQRILSDVGTAVFTDPRGMIEYFTNKPFMLYYSYIYFLVVIVLSIISIIIKARKKDAK